MKDKYLRSYIQQWPRNNKNALLQFEKLTCHPSLSLNLRIHFLHPNTISSSYGGTVRDKKRRTELGNAPVSKEEEHEEAEAGANRMKKSTMGQSIDNDRYRDKKGGGSCPRIAILSARRVFISPWFSSNRVDDGYRRLACPSTCTCREYRGYNEESFGRRTLPIACG